MAESPEARQRREEHSQAAVRLREQIPNILRVWAESVRAESSVANGLDQETLYNNLPKVLTQIAEILAEGNGRDAYAYAQIDAAKEHAHQRARIAGFTLEVVIQEYHLLRRVILEVMEQGGMLPQNIARVLHVGIDRAMQEAATFFVTENERVRIAGESERWKLIQQLLNAQETERQRISRELHDRSGQQLTALQLELSSLEPFCEKSDASEILSKIRAKLSDLSRDLHALSRQLRPLVLDDLGLAAALVSFFEESEERGGIPIDFQQLGIQDTPLPSEIETTLYRITQEAVTNVLRHAQATRVSIILEQRKSEVRLVVEDNGSGFDVETRLAGSKRLGLRGMRERAVLVGGTLELESAPGMGTTLFLRIPLTDRAE